MDEVYKMPVVHVGDMVYYKGDEKSTETVPGIVTTVGERAISVYVFPEGSLGGPRDSVKWIGDPKRSPQDVSGVWLYRDFDHNGDKVAARLESLEKRLADLEGALK